MASETTREKTRDLAATQRGARRLLPKKRYYTQDDSQRRFFSAT